VTDPPFSSGTWFTNLRFELHYSLIALERILLVGTGGICVKSMQGASSLFTIMELPTSSYFEKNNVIQKNAFCALKVCVWLLLYICVHLIGFQYRQQLQEC
jgi:hypothetical protein